MNRQFLCAVGVASGVFLLGGGVAQAAATADEAGHDMDLMATRGLPTDIVTPATNNAAADRTEDLLPGLGANVGGSDLLGLLGGGLMGKLTGEGGPLGNLLANGPLSALLGGKKAPANDGAPSAAVTADSPRTQGQARPTAMNPAADPASGSVAANPASQSAANSQPAAAYSPNNGGDGLEESQPGASPVGGMFGANGPLGKVEILGGDTFGNLPVVGDLLGGGGLNLNTLNNLTGISDILDQIGAQDPGKTLPSLGKLANVGTLSHTLLGEESASLPTEAAGALRAIDKTKVTPQVLPLFGPDALGIQALGGIVHQLPLTR